MVLRLGPNIDGCLWAVGADLLDTQSKVDNFTYTTLGHDHAHEGVVPGQMIPYGCPDATRRIHGRSVVLMQSAHLSTRT